MTRLSLLLPLLASFATAAPVPKPTEAEVIRKVFGTPSDPEKVCSARYARDTLTLTLKANTAAGVGDDRKTLPTFTREVAGDFTAVVRVRCEMPKGAERVAQRWSETGGGIVFIADNGRVFCHGLHDYEYRGERMRMVPNPPGHGPVGRRALVTDAGRFVRVSRVGATVMMASSDDGEKWENEETYRNYNDRPMRVGVYAAHNLNVETTVRLDHFSLEVKK